MIIFRRPVTGLSQTTLARFVARAKDAMRLRYPVNVLVTGNREMREMNHRFRQKNRETDVLSFPAGNGLAGFAGDIALSAEMAARNARCLGHTTAQEIKILVLHGLLHLAGYDHEQDHGEMGRKEARLRRALGLPTGLIERNVRSGRASPAVRRVRPRQSR